MPAPAGPAHPPEPSDGRRSTDTLRSTDSFFLYLPVREADVRWGLHVTGAGHAVIAPGRPYPPPKLHPEFYDFTWDRGRTLPEYQLVYLSHGRGEFESTRTGPRPVTPGTVLLLFPGEWHRYRPDPRTGWTEHWASFSGDQVRRLQAAGFFAPDRAVLDARPAEADLLAAFRRLLHRLQSGPAEVARPGVPQLLAADVLALLAAAWAAAPTGGADPAGTAVTAAAGPAGVRDRLVADAIRLIWSKSRRTTTVDDVVAELAVARRSLERHFREHLGHGIHDEIVRCRVARAKRLMADDPGLPVDQVATAAGFADARALRRSFQAAEGCTPQEFRALPNTRR